VTPFPDRSYNPVPGVIFDYVPRFNGEEIPMTMQIAMLGSDGIVIASDTKYTRGPQPDNAAKRYGYGSSKIGISEDGRIAAACSMAMKYSAQSAVSVFTDLEKDIHSVDRYCDYTKKIEQSADQALEGQYVQCIFGFADPEPALYRFTSYAGEHQEKEIKCQKVLDRIPGGDVTNSAIFWSEAFYGRLPVAQLITLAAQVVVSAGEINNGGIEGLEIVYADQKSSGFKRLTLAENRELQNAAKEKILTIGKRV
jgi:20S proteasome alpha/beta subunit